VVGLDVPIGSVLDVVAYIPRGDLGYRALMTLDEGASPVLQGG
jgi:hypothetical protein